MKPCYKPHSLSKKKKDKYLICQQKYPIGLSIASPFLSKISLKKLKQIPLQNTPIIYSKKAPMFLLKSSRIFVTKHLCFSFKT